MLKKIIKKFLYKKKWIHLRDVDNELRKDNVLNFFLNYLINVKKNLKIIQIGTNDGVTKDPLYNFLKIFHEKVDLISFEPQQRAFIKLKENYKVFKNVTLINKAIGNSGNHKFYYIDQKEIDKIKKFKNLKFSDGINSFEKKNLENRLIKNGISYDFDKFIKSVSKEVIDLKNALNEHKNLNEIFVNLDFLIVDCEGYDDQVIYNSDLKFFTPKIIYFEHKNLNTERNKSLLEFLRKENYYIQSVSRTDSIALKNDILS